MPGYYDYVLGAIPVVLLGLTAILTAAGLSLTLAVPASAAASLLVVGHALFVNGPVDASVEAPDAGAIDTPVKGD